MTYVVHVHIHEDCVCNTHMYMKKPTHVFSLMPCIGTLHCYRLREQEIRGGTCYEKLKSNKS